MKLRLRGNTARLRLDQPEIARLASDGLVEEVVLFAPGQELVYAIRADIAARVLAATFSGRRVEIVIPARDATRLAETDLVGCEFTQEWDGAQLRLIVEKDFTCMHPRPGEQDVKGYPNPREAVSERTLKRGG